ncbi:LacI family DNA-binding transcriptional regulator [Bifidobacterium asteroides]|uniref:LacI family transcriptional regulator n=1 Tax=Bifidobacterium asteroides TaxID=1684 RepID=A0A318MCS7_9BIFI|nr:LacI family DNA-binding transcriptional regulator [Bifidobacterium asteroides]PXY85778.1 LacI family transcriptional regulator [Bifidobacterium asteroides]
MRRRATLVDVAKRAGVSIGSVSNYLHNRPHMSEKMRKRIKDAVDDLGFVANESARTLRSGRTGLITLSIPDLRQVYFAELAEEVIRAARERGYGVIVESSGNSRERELACLSDVHRNMTDGLIMSPVKMSQDDLSLMEGDYPLVILGERVFGGPAPHVTVENEAASKAATEHLLRAGCKHIAVVGGSLDSSISSSRSLRTRGYLRALKEHGVTVDESLIRETGEWTSESGARAVRQMLAEGIRPDAIFALNDLQAFGVSSQLRELRIAVPEQIRVVGFDNIDEARYTIPSLTTVDPMRTVVAQKAIDLLIGQIETGRRASPAEYLTGYDIVYRHSSPKALS